MLVGSDDNQNSLYHRCIYTPYYAIERGSKFGLLYQRTLATPWTVAGKEKTLLQLITEYDIATSSIFAICPTSPVDLIFMNPIIMKTSVYRSGQTRVELATFPLLFRYYISSSLLIHPWWNLDKAVESNYLNTFTV